MRTTTGRYAGTAILWSGEVAPVYVEWLAETGKQVQVTSAGSVVVSGLHGTSYVQGVPSYEVGPGEARRLWFFLSSGTAWGGSALQTGDYNMEFTWYGTATGEATSRLMRRTVLLRIL